MRSSKQSATSLVVAVQPIFLLMRSFALYIPVLALAIMTACTTRPTADTPREIDDLREQMHGMWVGELPCDDCAGLDYRLVLAADGNFEERKIKLGHDPQALITDGYWYINDSILVIEKEDEADWRFIYTNGALEKLDSDGERVAEGYRPQYRLRSADIAQLSATIDSTMNFRASGQAPVWLVEFAQGGNLHFKAQDGNEIMVKTSRARVVNNELVYRGSNDSGKLELRLTHTPCVDGATESTFSHKVMAVYTPKATEEEELPTIYHGCGRYLVNNTLNNSWALVSYNGQAVSADGITAVQPTLQIQVEEQQALGTGSCNTFRASLVTKTEQLVFGNIAATEKACADMTLEADYFAALSNTTFRYKITDNNRLELRQGRNLLLFELQ
jgi:heat shock protein HslJ